MKLQSVKVDRADRAAVLAGEGGCDDCGEVEVAVVGDYGDIWDGEGRVGDEDAGLRLRERFGGLQEVVEGKGNDGLRELIAGGEVGAELVDAVGVESAAGGLGDGGAGGCGGKGHGGAGLDELGDEL